MNYYCKQCFYQSNDCAVCDVVGEKLGVTITKQL
jgi:hypothetical protein